MGGYFDENHAAETEAVFLPPRVWDAAVRWPLKTADLRKASAVRGRRLPYLDSKVTFLSVGPRGITQAKSSPEKQNMVRAHDPKTSVLLAAWPGQYSQDVFVLDDLAAVKDAVGLGKVEVDAEDLRRLLAEFEGYMVRDEAIGARRRLRDAVR